MKRIIVKTNPYQAQRNPLFGAHKTTAVLAENLTEEEAIEKLREYALDGFNDDTMPFESACDFVYDEIDRQLTEIMGKYTDLNMKMYCEAHSESIKNLAKQNGFKGPGLYMDGRLVYAFGDKSFDDDGYVYSIEDMEE